MNTKTTLINSKQIIAICAFQLLAIISCAATVADPSLRAVSALSAQLSPIHISVKLEKLIPVRNPESHLAKAARQSPESLLAFLLQEEKNKNLVFTKDIDLAEYIVLASHAKPTLTEIEVMKIAEKIANKRTMILEQITTRRSKRAARAAIMPALLKLKAHCPRELLIPYL